MVMKELMYQKLSCILKMWNFSWCNTLLSMPRTKAANYGEALERKFGVGKAFKNSFLFHFWPAVKVKECSEHPCSACFLLRMLGRHLCNAGKGDVAVTGNLMTTAGLA